MSGEREPVKPAPSGGMDVAALRTQLLTLAVPIVMLVLLIVAWQVYVVVANVPHYILPSPLRIYHAFQEDWGMLFKALLVTLQTTFLALAIALVTGVALAILMAQSRWIELALVPYAVI